VLDYGPLHVFLPADLGPGSPQEPEKSDLCLFQEHERQADNRIVVDQLTSCSLACADFGQYQRPR